MKPAPAPEIPGNSPWEKFDNAVRKVFTVPKDAVSRAEKKRKRKRQRAKAKAAA